MNKIIVHYSELKGKRLAAIDFGLKRVGIAVCDEYHITVSTRKYLDFTSPGFWKQLLGIILNENIYAVILGIPIRPDRAETNIIKKIKEFSIELEDVSGKKVILRDESFTSKKATETMIEIGMKKKKRQDKGTRDSISAAIILRDFLNEIA